MNPPELSYTIERTKNRTSRAVLKNGVVVIRLAKRLSLQEEQIHVQDLLRRMVKVAAKEATRSSITPFQPILDGANELHLELPGINQTLQIQLEPGKRAGMKIEGNVVKIKVPERITKKELINWLWRVTAFAIKEDIDRYVHDLNKQTFNVPITTITVRHMKSQWGSCSSFGKITLNTALLFLPQEVFDYVIIHELAHRLHRNHSQRFWNAVESVCPNYEELRKQMRKYRISA